MMEAWADAVRFRCVILGSSFRAHMGFGVYDLVRVRGLRFMVSEPGYTGFVLCIIFPLLPFGICAFPASCVKSSHGCRVFLFEQASSICTSLQAAGAPPHDRSA